MVEILLCVFPVIPMAMFSPTSRTSSKDSNLMIFMFATVSTRNLAIECNKSFDEISTPGDSRLSLVQRIFLVSLEISCWSDWSGRLSSRGCIGSFIGVIMIRARVV